MISLRAYQYGAEVDSRLWVIPESQHASSRTKASMQTILFLLEMHKLHAYNGWFVQKPQS